MKKKRLMSFLLACTMVAFSGVTSAVASDEKNKGFTADGEQDTKIQLTEEYVAPEEILFESMDKTIYVGTYWDGDILHVIPVPEKLNELSAVIEAATSKRSNFPTIVIDRIDERSSTTPIYSMAQREDGHEYLVANMDELKIEGVGFTADELAVFMSPDATSEDMDRVMNESPVKAIKFY